MKNLPISKRLFITFGAILVMFCCTVILAIVSLFSTGNNFDKFYNGAYEITNKSADLRASIQTVAKYIGYSMMEEELEQTKKYVQAAQQEIQVLRDGTTYLKENFDGDQVIINDYDNAMRSVMDQRDKVFELAIENKNQEAIKLYFSEVMPGFLKANEKLMELDNEASKMADRNYNSARNQKNIATVVLIGLAIITFIVTMVMAKIIIKSITQPIHELEAVAKDMVAGSLNLSITYDGKDEMGSLANSMDALTNNVKIIIEDIARILADLANGNFQTTSSCLELYVQDYVPILNAMRLIRNNLNSTLLQINEASQQVAMGSSQLAESAQGLAQGATEQAGAVEELTATIESVANMAETNTDSAKKAYGHVKTSVEKAEIGRKEMDELIKAMEHISMTSKEIENIIVAIEDIASQTNLLSLNASIEAARAGEAGRGFAVVADQIGKLASDSAQSAINTKELISKTLEEIENGNQITMKTSEAFEEVIEDMKEFAGVADSSSKNSMLQYETLKEIQTGIEQISSVVQNNSATAEETSATSEELSAQAYNLETQVSKFNLIQELS